MIVTAADERLDPSYGYGGMVAISLFNLIVTGVNMGMVVYKTYYSTASYWNSYWAPIDTLFCIINFAIIGLVLYYQPTQALRILEAFATILLA